MSASYDITHTITLSHGIFIVMSPTDHNY